MALDRTLFEITVKESDRGREYWLDRPWLIDRREAALDADVLVVPWEDFREGESALFPQGAADLVQQLSEKGPLTLFIAIDEERYQEILLHSKKHRFPTMLVKAIALPALAGMLGNIMSDLIKGGKSSDTVEITVVVEGDHGHCISLAYQGPPSRVTDTLLKEAERCLPPTAPTSPTAIPGSTH